MRAWYYVKKEFTCKLNDACSRAIHHLIFINFLPIVLMQCFLRRDYVCLLRFIAELRENLTLSSCCVSWQLVVSVNRTFVSLLHACTMRACSGCSHQIFDCRANFGKTEPPSSRSSPLCLAGLSFLLKFPEVCRHFTCLVRTFKVFRIISQRVSPRCQAFVAFARPPDRLTAAFILLQCYHYIFWKHIAKYFIWIYKKIH